MHSKTGSVRAFREPRISIDRNPTGSCWRPRLRTELIAIDGPISCQTHNQPRQLWLHCRQVVNHLLVTPNSRAGTNLLAPAAAGSRMTGPELASWCTGERYFSTHANREDSSTSRRCQGADDWIDFLIRHQQPRKAPWGPIQIRFKHLPGCRLPRWAAERAERLARCE